MEVLTNKFGSGEIYSADDLKGSVYCICTACMGIYSEFLTWANSNQERMVLDPAKANSIIVLSCQVTDLAVLNDIMTLEKYQVEYPDKSCYIGGCLAKRFDIDLPTGTLRLGNVDCDGVSIDDFNLIEYAKPFWVPDYKEDDSEVSDGHLFRNMYPLRIGVGCKGKCTYCTIRVTRGDYKEIHFNRTEFLQHDNVVLIADSPTTEQISQWCDAAITENKPISIRNVEPKVVRKVAWQLLRLAEKGLLAHFHSPIQHTDPAAIKEMGRNQKDVPLVRGVAKALRAMGVFTATNIIIDYGIHPDPDESLKEDFDYISWNPYWDGVWDRGKAEQRFKHYFGK